MPSLLCNMLWTVVPNAVRYADLFMQEQSLQQDKACDENCS